MEVQASDSYPGLPDIHLQKTKIFNIKDFLQNLAEFLRCPKIGCVDAAYNMLDVDRE